MIMALETERERGKAIALYEKYYSTMMYVAQSILKDYALAEDAVSEAMIKIIHNLDKINMELCHKTKGYIVVIVKHTALNLLKKRNNMHETDDEALAYIPDENGQTLDNIISAENYQIILDVILSLPEKLSSVLYLSAVMNYSNSEISTMLDIKKDAVRARLSRARRAVVEKLGGDIHE